MRRVLAATFAVVLGAALSASAQPAPGKGGVVEAGFTRVRATVLKVDVATRNVELKDDAGKTFAISVAPEMKNLDQVRPGDVVLATMTDSLAYEIKAPGTAKPGENVVATGDSGKAGEKPKGTTRKVTTKTVTITAIDTKTSSVTFKTATGETKTVVAKEPSRLVGVKVGDLVEVTYTEALVFSVEKAPATK